MLNIFGEVKCVRRGRCCSREQRQVCTELCNVCVQVFGVDSALLTPLLTRIASSQIERQGAGLHFADFQSLRLWLVVGAILKKKCPLPLHRTTRFRSGLIFIQNLCWVFLY